MANINDNEPGQVPFRTAEEAWAQCSRFIGVRSDDRVSRAIFYAGMGAAIGITYHYGFVDLRAEVDRAAAEMRGE